MSKRKKENTTARTVNDNGNDFAQNEAVGSLKRGDLAQWVDLVVLCRLVEGSRRVGLGLDHIHLQPVALRREKGGDRTPVLLFMRFSIIPWQAEKTASTGGHLLEDRKSFRMSF